MILLRTLLGISAATLVLLVAFAVRRRRAARRRAHEDLQVAARAQAKQVQRRALEHDLAEACAHASTVDEVVGLLEAALVSLDPRRPYELHLVDPHEPVLRLAFATGLTARRAADASPWQSLAAQRGTTLVYATTDVADLCPHLATRLVEHCSAVAVPLIAADRLVGVLYATGPEDSAPSTSIVATYEQFARTAAVAIAAGHALDTPRRGPEGRADDHEDAGHDYADDDPDDDDADLLLDLRDRLLLHDGTLLAGRAAAEEVIGDLIATATPFTLLLFDIDGFGSYHARHGATTGDEAMRALADAAHRALGGLGLFRLDGDHLLVVLADADAARALRTVDELRGEIHREIRARELPPPTVSFGVVEAAPGTDASRILYAAHDALYNARARGNASTVLGLDVISGAP